jgi:hypothetical protein
MSVLDANGMILSPALARQLAALACLRLGWHSAISLGVEAKMNRYQVDAWERCAIPVMYIDDYAIVSESPTKTFCGVPLVEDPEFPRDQIAFIDHKGNVIASLINIGVEETA